MKVSYYLIIPLVILVIIIGKQLLVVPQQLTVESQITASDVKTDIQSETTTDIYVQISGAVSNPDVYTYPAGTRVQQLFTDADAYGNTACFNLAAKLVDEEKFIIPAKEEGCSEESAIDDNGVVNINTASALELATINGIGEAKADNIVEYRNANGSFESKSDLLNVEGINENLLNSIADSIRLS